MLRVNANFSLLPGAYLFAEIARRVRAYEAEHPDADVVRMGIGDVTRPLAPEVVEAMRAAAKEMGTPDGFRGYGPDYGYPFLIDAIRAHDYAPLGVQLAEDEVFISDGAKSDTSDIQELFDAGARVAVTDPVYPVYVDSNAMAGRAGTYADGRWSNLVYLPCTAENGFVPPLPEGDVDVIYLCYPNNPTGTTLTAAQLRPFVDYARERGAVIVYDAAYKAFITQAGVPRSIYEIPGAREVAVECCSFSKTAGFTGVRCAWTVIPHEVCGLLPDGARASLNALWKRRMGTKFNGVSYPVQRAAAAVYTPDGQRQCRDTVAYYQRNAALIREGLQGAGYTVYGGVDAPYVWLKTPPGESSWAFFDRLLTKANVVGTPGAGFGPSGEGYFRLTAFGTLESTREALRRVRERM